MSAGESQLGIRHILILLLVDVVLDDEIVSLLVLYDEAVSLHNDISLYDKVSSLTAERSIVCFLLGCDSSFFFHLTIKLLLLFLSIDTSYEQRV